MHLQNYTLFAILMRIIDDHEMKKSYQTGDLFLEFLSLVSRIASIKMIVLKLND